MNKDILCEICCYLSTTDIFRLSQTCKIIHSWLITNLNTKKIIWLLTLKKLKRNIYKWMMNGALLSFVRSRSRISRIQIIGTEIKKNLFKVVGNTLNLDRPSLDLITDIRFQFDDQIDQTPKIVIYAGSTHFMKIPNYCIEIRDLYLRNFGMIYDYFTVEIDSKTEAQLCTFSGLSINDLKFRNKFTLVMDHHSYGHIYKSGCSFEEGKEYWNFAWNGNGMVLSCFGQYSNFFCPNNLRELDKKVDKKFRKYYHNLPNLVDQ